MNFIERTTGYSINERHVLRGRLHLTLKLDMRKETLRRCNGQVFKENGTGVGLIVQSMNAGCFLTRKQPILPLSSCCLFF